MRFSSSARPFGLAQRKLSLASSVLAWTCVIVATVLPLTVLGAVVSWYLGYSIPPDVPVSRALFSPQTSIGLKIIAGVLFLLPVLATSFSLLRARACFQSFAAGVFFAPATVSALRGFAAGMAAAQFMGVVVQPAIGLLMMWAGPPIKGAVTLNLGSQQLLFFLFAGMVWAIAEVMTRAVTLAEENAQFV